jgi:CO/xanthine dehydrogenase FAD-binding subunit
MDLAFVDSLEPASRASLEQWRDGDAWLAGGTSLFAEPQPRLRRLLDLRAFGWPALTAGPDAGLQIAATCTLAELAAYPVGPDQPATTLFRSCAEALYASWKVWSEATVGGNVCLALPAGAMTSLTAALDGVATIWQPGGSSRQLPVADFVTGAGTNALAPGELLRAITLPGHALAADCALRQASLAPRGRSAAVVIGRHDRDGTAVITVTASVTRPLVLHFDALPEAAELDDALAAAAATGRVGYHDDVHGDPDWRRHLTVLLAEQVRAELAARDA